MRRRCKWTAVDDLPAHCKERLARYKYPPQVKILKELSRGPTGKILKAELTKGEF